MKMSEKTLKRPLKIDIKKAIAHFNSKQSQEVPEMTFATLADAMGLKKTTLYGYQNGLSKCSIDVIKVISEKTGCPICEFVPIKID